MFERSQIPCDLSDSKEHLLHKKGWKQKWSSNSRHHKTRVTTLRARGNLSIHFPAAALVLACIHCKDCPSVPSQKGAMVDFLPTSNGYHRLWTSY